MDKALVLVDEFAVETDKDGYADFTKLMYDEGHRVEASIFKHGYDLLVTTLTIGEGTPWADDPTYDVHTVLIDKQATFEVFDIEDFD